MRARDLAVPFPSITLSSPVLEAARLLADNNLPGLIVVDDRERPVSVLPGAQVLRLVIPGYCREDPTLARMIDEPTADVFFRGAEGRTVRDLLPRDRPEPPVVEPQATVLEVAAVMAQRLSPLVAVAPRGEPMIGGITLDALLDRMLAA
ncbi:CBS domain-containing protein [Micromonospora sp. WMMD1128]|uniref:CBS domain-containing protein n=1 Tax=unclassified Micromonospora TaxID=2617518 RepID=UPI00248CF8E2|nr:MULTISPECIES: CBS domain-containing protein [unclassified Micromonospora]WBB76654.1 CBS domain-containing protein [Micromonospora sp. WMMD1128]WFE35558.1 CBS domain-containing protein [Micromonospora sp. WMMD975]WFE40255.1 CBS domain-containing protein [Micromonospora sp. WMMD998]